MNMKLLLVRHAKAEEKDDFSKVSSNDDLRPLVTEGISIQKKASRGLKSIVAEVTILASSPLVRAVQTAEILSHVYDGARVLQTSLLSPGESPVDFIHWLEKVSRDVKSEKRSEIVVVCVGHEPGLGELVSYLLSERQTSFIEFKKSGACLIEFPDSIIEEGAAFLKWFMTPSQLSQLS